jgi:Leucine-rich repeat (LRR) protein
MYIQSLGRLGADNSAPFRFSSLQPLSTLQQLEVLDLGGHACDATSLQGLAGLSNLEVLNLELLCRGGRLKTVDGISPTVIESIILNAPKLDNLAGIQGCRNMEKLNLHECGVSSLQPLQALTRLEELRVCACPIANLEGLSSRSVHFLCLVSCTLLTHLSGVEHLSTLKSLELRECGVTSLQPLSQLGEGLREMIVFGCKGVQEEVLELPHVQPTAIVAVNGSNVREVVLAGGVRQRCFNR